MDIEVTINPPSPEDRWDYPIYARSESGDLCMLIPCEADWMTFRQMMTSYSVSQFRRFVSEIYGFQDGPIQRNRGSVVAVVGWWGRTPVLPEME